MKKLTSGIMNLILVCGLVLFGYMVAFDSDRVLCLTNCVEEVVVEEDHEKTMYVLSFTGGTGMGNAQKFLYQLDEFEQRYQKGDALFVKVTSGGGNVLFANQVWRRLDALRDNGVKIITSVDIAALSGGYLIASTGNRIFAADGSAVGSVGVYTIATTKNTGRIVIGSTREKELFGGRDTIRTREDIEMIREDTKATLKLFIARILENREVKNQEKAFTGKSFDSRVALEHGLIDGIADSRTVLRSLVRQHDFNVTVISANPIVEMLYQANGDN